MTDYHPADRPGHLDIDAVSAFVDRDLAPDDLTTIEFHLHECPACHREVLEIRTTVVLLAGLPQYTPRRSFCLGHEHARASRRASRGHSWSGAFAPTGYPASTASVAAYAQTGRAATWLPGLQAVAVVIGALLLLVTTSDLMGMPPQPAEWLAEPEAPVTQMDFRAAPAPAPTQPSAPALQAASDRDAAGLGSSKAETSFPVAAKPAQGTTDGDSASQEVLGDAQLATKAFTAATSPALAAVTRAVPTPAAGLARSPVTATDNGDAGDAPAGAPAPPSRLRLAQLVLAFALAWLVVTIVGLRWVRGLRRASS